MQASNNRTNSARHDACDILSNALDSLPPLVEDFSYMLDFETKGRWVIIDWGYLGIEFTTSCRAFKSAGASGESEVGDT